MRKPYPMQSRFSNAYCHPHIACIQSVWPQFSPQSHLAITQDVRDSLQQEHKEAMCVAFAITILYWNMFPFTILIPYSTSCYNRMCSIDQLFM
jgi:hypothetical protein